MSVVTSVILVVSGEVSPEVAAALSQGDPNSSTSPSRGDKQVRFDRDLGADHALVSGWAAVQCSVFIGAFNGCDDASMVEWLRGIPWGPWAEHVVAVIVYEHCQTHVVPIYGAPVLGTILQ